MVANPFRASRTRRGAATLTPAAFLVTPVAPVASGYERGQAGPHQARVRSELASCEAGVSRASSTICTEGAR